MTAIGASLVAASAIAQPDVGASAQEAYRAGDYAKALPLFEQAHQQEPANFDYQWGLAQTLRQTSQCDKALLHYQALREAAPDAKTARDVRDQMALCPGGAIEEEAPPPPPPPPSPTAAQARAASAPSRGAWLLAAGAGAGLGLSVVFFLDYRASNDAADAAARFDDHEKFSARADRMLIASGVAAVVGLGLTVVSIRRFNSSREQKPELAIVPRSDGATVVWEGSW